jgi:hypothetical protein
MISLAATAVVFLKLLGFAVVIATALCAILYHMGWRNDHPDGFWPLRAVLGFGGVLMAGTGLIFGSLMLLVVGMLAYLGGLIMRADPAPPRTEV